MQGMLLFYRIKNIKIIGGVQAQHMIIQQKIDLWLIITQMVHYQPVSKIISHLVFYFPNKNRENMKSGHHLCKVTLKMCSYGCVGNLYFLGGGGGGIL